MIILLVLVISISIQAQNNQKVGTEPYSLVPNSKFLNDAVGAKKRRDANDKKFEEECQQKGSFSSEELKACEELRLEIRKEVQNGDRYFRGSFTLTDRDEEKRDDKNRLTGCYFSGVTEILCPDGKVYEYTGKVNSFQGIKSNLEKNYNRRKSQKTKQE